MTDLAANLNELERYLQRFRESGIPNIINGQKTAAKEGNVFSTYSPTDESAICTVADSGAEDIDAAAKAARAAFPEWRDFPAGKRKQLLHAIADAIERRAQEIALCECWDTGQALRYMSKAALRGAENFRFFADRAPSARDGQALPAASFLNLTTRVPIGPVGVITPWNTPFMLSTWKIAPALAAGCTVVHKPAELSPLTATLLAEIAEEAGVPAGVWNVVNGDGEKAGKPLTEHPDIRAIAFVGESHTGKMIMKQGADTLKRVHFELGGKNPVIVFDDADMERALDAVIFMIYSFNGERCTSSSRLLVQDNIADEFEKRLIERVNNIKVGHPLDPATEVGPLIDKGHFGKVSSYLKIAEEEGARVTGGGRNGEKGYFIHPAVCTGASNQMRIAQEEIFGPVLTVIRFESEEEAVQMANDIDYGLTGFVWTNDLSRALRVTDRLEAGMIWVNSENVRHLPTPFGGVKASGIGRDGGDWSFEFYMEQKHISLADGSRGIPRLGV